MPVIRALVGLSLATCSVAACSRDDRDLAVPPTVPAVAPIAPAPARSPLRFMIRDQVVDGDGLVVARVPNLDARYWARPVGGDHYAFDHFLLDAANATAVPLPAIYNPMEGDYAIGDGFVIASPLHGELQRVDVASGAVRWKVHASGYGLAIVGDEVDVAECASDGRSEHTAGYALVDGARRFVSPARPGCHDLVAQAGHVFVRDDAQHSVITDLAGHVWLDAKAAVQRLTRAGDDYILVTERGLAGVSATGAVRWRIASEPFMRDSWIEPLPDGDVIVARWMGGSNSGFELWRLRPSDGRVAWHTWVPAIPNIAHSKYANVSYLAVHGDKLFAVSQASGGDIFERLDLATGARELRCQPITACSSPAAIEAKLPFVVGNQLVAPDGHVVHAIAGVDATQVAHPRGGHTFEVGGYIVNAEDDTARRLHPIAELRARGTGDDHNDVVGFDFDGSVRWRQPLDGVRSVRPPDVAITYDRVFATVMGTLRAFDHVGHVKWSANADAFDLTVVGDTVYYVTCNSPSHDHWLFGRSSDDGAIRFRAALADDCDPHLVVDDQHVVAVDSGSTPLSIVFNHAGHELYRLHERIASIHAVDQDLVVISDHRIARIGDRGTVVWALPAPHDDFVTAAGFIDIPGGDLIVATYCAISDDGIELQRIGGDGQVRWHTHVPGLDVAHSEYEQLVYLELRGAAALRRQPGLRRQLHRPPRRRHRRAPCRAAAVAPTSCPCGTRRPSLRVGGSRAASRNARAGCSPACPRRRLRARGRTPRWRRPSAARGRPRPRRCALRRARAAPASHRPRAR